MSEFSNTLAIVLGLNLFLFMGQIAVLDMNPNQTFYNCEGTIVSSFSENCTTGDRLNSATAFNTENLPEQPSSADNPFIDIFNAMKSWFLSEFGSSYLGQVLLAPYNLLSFMGLPVEFIFIIGTVWYGLTFFLLIEWLRGI